LRKETDPSYHTLLGFTEAEIKMNFCHRFDNNGGLKNYFADSGGTENIFWVLKAHQQSFHIFTASSI